MNFKTSSDAVRFLSNFGFNAEFPINGGVFRAVNHHASESFEVIGKRIWVVSKDENGRTCQRYLDEDPALIKELSAALAN